MFAISHNIPEIKDKLERLRKLATGSGNFQDVMVKILNRSLRTVKRLTPVSGGKFRAWTRQLMGRNDKHVRDGWTLRIIGGSGKDRVPVVGYIFNKFTHVIVEGGLAPKEDARLKTATGGKKNYTVLEILEYGSKPHVIRPVKRKFLRFDTGGKTVFTKEVHHPGTRPYGMVRVTRARTRLWLQKMMRRWERKFVNEWRKG